MPSAYKRLAAGQAKNHKAKDLLTEARESQRDELVQASAIKSCTERIVLGEESLAMQSLRSMHQWIVDSGEPYVKEWVLGPDPVPCICLTAVYMILVKWIGPAFMRNRKPYNLKVPMMLHNVFLILLNIWIFYAGGMMAWFEPSKYTECFVYGHRDRVREAYPSYVYYISKYFDWFDTLFLVLRKKDSHISTLHVYHHGSMPLASWFFFKLAPGGHVTFSGFANSFVHVVMYTYYLLASFGPQMQPYLTWKRYLTQLQLIQFVTCFLHSFQWFFRPCTHPMILTYILCLNSTAFLILFANFYISTYRRKRQASKSA